MSLKNDSNFERSHPPRSSPACPVCEKRMHLVTSRPHPMLAELDECLFHCACGAKGTYVMPWKD